MEQFNLDAWLQDKSRKVLTRDGRPVRIICWDKKDSEYPIVGLVSNENGLKEKEGCCSFTIDGKAWGESYYDLFFADEEEELTEFEKRFIELIRLLGSGNTNPEENLTQSQFDAKELLDLARKELGLVDNTCGEYALNEAYKQGKKYALKDLPKWKDVSGKNGAGTKDYENVGYYLVKGNYAIYLEDLEKLPKE